MSAKLRDIAKATNTSVSTVSRVLAGGAKAATMGLQTRQRILEAAQRLNYQPHFAARALRTQRSNTIALIGWMGSPHLSRIAHLIDRLLHARGYWLVYCNSDQDSTRETNFLRQLPQRGIDGAIVAPFATDAAQIKNNVADDFPMVVLQHQIEGLGPTVAPDGQQEAALLCQTLHKAGVRRIALISGPQSYFGGHISVQAAAQGITVAARFEGPVDPKTGRQAYGMLIGPPHLWVDAVVCTAMTMAQGLLQAMPSLALPSPVPILAVNDSMSFMHLLPIPIVCVVTNIAALAEGCVNALLSLLENQVAGRTQTIVPPLSLFPSDLEYNSAFAALLPRDES